MAPQYRNWVQQREGFGEWPHFGEGFPSGPLEPLAGTIPSVSPGYAGTPQSRAELEAWEAGQKRAQHTHRFTNKIGMGTEAESSMEENPSGVNSQEQLHTGTVEE